MSELQDLTWIPIATWCLVIVTITAIIYQVRVTARSRSAETLMHLDDVWRSEELRRIRAAAPATLLDKRETGKTAQQLYESNQSDVDEVLDFLETVAFLCARKVLDRELVWNMFYWLMENYWNACADYVQHVRLNEGSRTGKICLRNCRVFEAKSRRPAPERSDGCPISTDGSSGLFPILVTFGLWIMFRC